MNDIVLISPTNNPLYPLPRDYESLTVEGQRLARVNACRQCFIPGPDSERADRRVASTWFFDSYYLHPDESDDFDPLFYDQPPLPTPDHHWLLSRMWETNRLNVAMAPRGSAKTTHCAKDMIHYLVSATAYSFTYATSTHDNTKKMGQMVKDQVYENSRIQSDFAPSYDLKTLKPARGVKPTGIDFFYLSNGSYIRCVSAESRLRGLRARRFRLDDPEYDEKSSTSLADTRRFMDRLIFRIALPMSMRGASGVDWVGTFVSKRHFLWHAMQVTQTASGPKSNDPRFDYWARLLIRAAYRDETGTLVSCWPAMWPLNAADKALLPNPNAVDLDQMRREMGSVAFNHEMMGNPGSSEEQYFKLDISPRGKHAYWFENIDPEFSTDPHSSSTLICWIHSSDPDVPRKVPLSEFLRQCRLFVTVDTAYTELVTSDRRCATLMAVTRDNELFVLDMWSERKPDAVLLRTVFSMCQRWRCPTVCVEVVRESFALYKRFKSAVETKMGDEMGFTFLPSIRDLRPGTMSKQSKIESLDLRFEHNLIKLPVSSRYDKPWWDRLFDQIEGFNPDSPNGGLEKDDELDTVSMSMMVLRSKMAKSPEDPAVTKPDPVAEILAGRLTMPGGCSYASGLPLQYMTEEVIAKLLDTPQESPTSDTRI